MILGEIDLAKSNALHWTEAFRRCSFMVGLHSRFSLEKPQKPAKKRFPAALKKGSLASISRIFGATQRPTARVFATKCRALTVLKTMQLW